MMRYASLSDTSSSPRMHFCMLVLTLSRLQCFIFFQARSGVKNQLLPRSERVASRINHISFMLPSGDSPSFDNSLPACCRGLAMPTGQLHFYCAAAWDQLEVLQVRVRRTHDGRLL